MQLDSTPMHMQCYDPYRSIASYQTRTWLAVNLDHEHMYLLRFRSFGGYYRVIADSR